MLFLILEGKAFNLSLLSTMFTVGFFVNVLHQSEEDLLSLVSGVLLL